MKRASKNNKFQLVGPTWDEEFELSDGLYSVSDAEDYFEHIKKHEKTISNFPIQMYINTLMLGLIFNDLHET